MCYYKLKCKPIFKWHVWVLQNMWIRWNFNGKLKQTFWMFLYCWSNWRNMSLWCSMQLVCVVDVYHGFYQLVLSTFWAVLLSWWHIYHKDWAEFLSERVFMPVVQLWYLWRSWDCHWKAVELSTLEWMSLATTSREWTSIVQIVMIFWRSCLLNSPSRR